MRFVSAAILLAILATGLAVRAFWIRSDPPVTESVGVVWHDEGAWVHNARNRALWGTWRTDEWNPVFIAPVFTALEFASFHTFGVGIWQARVIPIGSGLLAILALAFGLHALAGRRAALAGALLLATNYAFVMWNRAALMESTMTAFMVVAWAAYAQIDRRPAWGLVAGAAAVLAWFTKASSAFFVAALCLDATVAIALSLTRARSTAATRDAAAQPRRRGALLALLGLALTAAIVATAFVWPHWREYQFYNWQMTVERKPQYGWRDFVQRASWLPIVESLLARSWLELVAGLAGAWLIVLRWTRARPAERLLVLWLGLGLLELVVHDAGNERRYVMFLPALIALSALALSSPRLADLPVAAGRVARAVSAALALVAGYLIVGSLLRPIFTGAINAGHLSGVVRGSGIAAAVFAVAVYVGWPKLLDDLRRRRLPSGALLIFTCACVTLDMTQYVDWARHRGAKNYAASVALSHVLPAGTLVQGKLANGLALETAIKPLFVGNGFGNYQDRLSRDDARYILTYDLPAIGYESSNGSGLIQGILDRYPRWRVVATFDVDETPGVERAVLIDKFPETTSTVAHSADSDASPADSSRRAPDLPALPH